MTLIELWCHENEHIVQYILNVNIFSSPDPKAKVSFSIKMCSLSVVIFVVNFSQINFCKTLVQFQPNLAIIIFELRGFKCVQIKGYILFKGRWFWKIYGVFQKSFLKSFSQKSLILSKSIMRWCNFMVVLKKSFQRMEPQWGVEFWN